VALRSGRRCVVWASSFEQCGCQAGPTRFVVCPEFPKSVQICKFKTDAFYCSKKFQILCEVILEYSEHLFQLCQLQILNRNLVKILGTDSIFESFMNFKGVQTFWEKTNKFFKNLS
jgi:hypothetical protein